MNTDQPHIVVVDDDQDIREPLAKYLRQHGFRASVAANGTDLEQSVARSRIDLIVLDIMMPGEDGLSICKRLQGQFQIPIILLTALGEDTDRIVGLELGADDYITKPFNPRELIARIRSVLRRHHALPPRRSTEGLVLFDRWRFDFTRQEVLDIHGVVTPLSSGEHLLLISFIENPGVTLNRDQLLDLTKGRESQLFERSIDNQISRLRRKLEEDPKHPQIIQTEWGRGYVFAAELEWIQ